MTRLLILAAAFVLASCCRPTAALGGELLACYKWDVVSVYDGIAEAVKW